MAASVYVWLGLFRGVRALFVEITTDDEHSEEEEEEEEQENKAEEGDFSSSSSKPHVLEDMVLALESKYLVVGWGL